MVNAARDNRKLTKADDMIGSSLKSCGQKDLEDNGKCEWDDGIRSGLDREYPDWKNPCKTHMIPESFPRKANNEKGLHAEEVVYNLLQQLGEQNSEPMFVVHSFDFSEHIHGYRRKRSWVMGESDFIIVHKIYGPIFIQVKGTDSGNKYKEAEEQLRKDKLALENFFKKLSAGGKFSKRKASEMFKNYPGFVAMPNCRRGQSVLVQENVLYQEDCSSLEAFTKWWNNNISSAQLHPAVSEEIFEFLVMRFVGSVMVSPYLPSQVSIDETYDFLKFNTRQQLKVLLDSSSQKWIIGPAGSGKTSLLLEKVTLLAQKILINSLNEKILVVCYNKPLSLMITKVFESTLRVLLQGNELSSVVHVKTFDKLLMDINGSFNINDGEKGVIKALENLQQLTSSERTSYEHIFVDEAQDLYGAQWENLLKMLHKSSPNDPAAEDDDFEPRYFWVFYDANQHLHLTKEQIAPHSASLRNSARLHQVLRNTKHIFLQVEKYFRPIVEPSTPVGVYHGRDGLKIAWDDGAEDLCVVKRLKYLQEQGVQNNDICILARNVFERDNLMLYLAQFGVVSQNAEELWKEDDNNKVVVESVRRFKGLESKVVILHNPPFCHSSDNSKTRELLYTAVSRSACFLIAITTKVGCEALQSTEGLIDTSLSCRSRGGLNVSHSAHPVSSGQYREGEAVTSQELPEGRSTYQDASMLYYLDLYNKLKEMVGDVGGQLLEPRNNNIEDSVRIQECAKLLPSVWLNVQLCPEYKDVSQSALNMIVALLEYRVFCQCKFRNCTFYRNNVGNMKLEIDASSGSGVVSDHVAGALGITESLEQ